MNTSKDLVKVSPFAQKIYDTLLKVPKGKLTTYKQLAEASGTRAYRAVGLILSKNPFAPDVPCHRVIASDGTLGGFMGSKGVLTVSEKIKLLVAEGIKIKDGKVVDYESILFDFNK